MIEDKIENVCDLSYLTEIMGGKKHLIRGIMDTFLTQIPEELNSINEAILTTDYDKIKRYAHTMKSSVTIVGITVLITILKELEELGKTAGSMNRINELNRELTMICKKALEEIEAAKPNYV